MSGVFSRMSRLLVSVLFIASPAVAATTPGLPILPRSGALTDTFDGSDRATLSGIAVGTSPLAAPALLRPAQDLARPAAIELASQTSGGGGAGGGGGGGRSSGGGSGGGGSGGGGGGSGGGGTGGGGSGGGGNSGSGSHSTALDHDKGICWDSSQSCCDGGGTYIKVNLHLPKGKHPRKHEFHCGERRLQRRHHGKRT
nr:hypothetical protein [uncultured Gellertiella sp.]